jgi:transcriptional antiterminator RfaH
MSWACAVTFWHQQEDVIEQLAAKGFEYFFPRIKRTVRHRGKRVHRLDPLLFNYLPIKLAPGWEEIHGMRGVVDMIGPVREVEIQKLRDRCNPDGILVQLTAPRFKPGQPVRPALGPLSDKIGTFVGELRDQREAALFDILGARRSVKFEAGNLVAA